MWFKDLRMKPCEVVPSSCPDGSATFDLVNPQLSLPEKKGHR